MITRTLKQVKVFDVKARGTTLMGHGWSESIPGLTWVNGQIWESDAECDQCLQSAVEDWEHRLKDNPWGTTTNKPQVSVYWQTIAIDENNA